MNMRKKRMNLMDVGHVLGRNEMKKIMAGCGSYCFGGDGSNGGSADCYICSGGVDCKPAGPGDLGWTGCDDSSGTNCVPSGDPCEG